jgi:hypothetical protein
LISFERSIYTLQQSRESIPGRRCKRYRLEKDGMPVQRELSVNRTSTGTG